jgi:2-C-methyl-D-erythritol 2,4-cyclodiphosphate synthase
VRLVEGEPGNIKITTPDDLRLARRWVERDSPAAGLLRVGTGYDLHRLAPGRPLVLGGVEIPHAAGLAGHSDADALSHAIIDAVLGAAAAGDIGRHFPDTDPQWAGASSLDLLRRAAGMVREAGFTIVNVDAVVVAERPKLAPHVAAMCERLARAMGIEASSVSVKGKTNEGLGEIGRGEAVAVHAVALVAGADPGGAR